MGGEEKEAGATKDSFFALGKDTLVCAARGPLLCPLEQHKEERRRRQGESKKVFFGPHTAPLLRRTTLYWRSTEGFFPRSLAGLLPLTVHGMCRYSQYCSCFAFLSEPTAATQEKK